MKNLAKKHQSKKEITASKLEHVKMRLRIVWSKTFGQFSLKKSAQLKLQKNIDFTYANYSPDVSMTLRLGQQVRPDEIGR
jgi:hypothetical protein